MLTIRKEMSLKKFALSSLMLITPFMIVTLSLSLSLSVVVPVLRVHYEDVSERGRSRERQALGQTGE